MRHLIIASILGLALTGCPDRTISSVSPEQGRVDFKDIPVKQERSVDILFVIDDSGSMQDKQNNLRDNFPRFIEVLETIQGGLPDVHIGVITSDVGTKGEDDVVPGPAIMGGCSGTGRGGNLQTFGVTLQGGPFISDIKQPDGTRQRNYNGDLATTFGDIAASAGAANCGFEQHLHAMKRALSNNPANVGFIRDDAFLAVIILADEDDCSMKHSTLLGTDSSLGPRQSMRCTDQGVTCDVGGATVAAMRQVGQKDQCHPNDNSEFLAKVSDYVKFLKTLKPDDPTKIVVAGILGTTSPFQIELRAPQGGGTPIPALAHSCTYQSPTGPQVADPPIRLKFFLDQFPNRSTFTTICQEDLSEGLELIAQLLKAALGDPCITSDLLDIDPGTAGLQPNCSVSYVFNSGLPNRSETILPECDGGLTNKPCWHIIADPTKCPARDNLILKVEDDVAQPDGTHIVSGCEANVN